MVTPTQLNPIINSGDMSKGLIGISDEIKLISFGKTLHPLTFLLSFSFGFLFIFPIIDAFGVGPGFLFCISILWGGYVLQRYLASQLQNTLISTVEIIDFYHQEITYNISLLSGSVERDIVFVGVNVNDIDDVRIRFSSLVESVYHFRTALKKYNFIDFLFLSFGESATSLGYREIIHRIDNYLGGFFSESLLQVQNILHQWVANHREEITSNMTELGETQLQNLSGRRVFETTIRRLESHKSDLDKVRARI